MTVGLVPLMGTLLTIKDGQGVDSTGAAVRVIIFGAAAEGQEVPQGAETVERGVEDWALAPTATRTRARAAGKNFMLSTGILDVERLK